MEIKKVTAGLLKSSCDINEYDPGRAREVAKEVVSNLEYEWQKVKNKLREYVSGRGEE